MEVKCLGCGNEVILPFEFSFKYYICPQCFKGHSYKNGILTAENKLSIANFKSHIPIGKSTFIENKTYCISNVILKKFSDSEFWREYELISENGTYKYLTEEKGNWTISEQIELDKNFNRLEIHHNDMDFPIFEKGVYQDYSGVGFFDFKIQNNNIQYTDFVCPPYLISVEIEEDEQIVYFGNHISENEIKKLFDLNVLPWKSTIGMVQPFYVNLQKVVTIFCYASLIIMVSHLIFYQTASNQLVYSNTIDLVNGNDKEVATEVFELKGPIAPLKIFIQTGVNNSWLATDFSLINETTGEVAYFSKDVEYYHGYEGGENWTEGSTSEEFNICGVSSGKYKILFKPSKDSNDVYNSEMNIQVYWNKSDNWNFMFVLIVFVVITVILYFIKNNFEQRRWSDSDYSPFSKEEE
jgi:hypothetical protein